MEQLREPFAQVAELLADAAPDILAFTGGPGRSCGPTTRSAEPGDAEGDVAARYRRGAWWG